MSVPVLTAVLGPGEAALVAGLSRPGGPVHVVRRCADLAEVMSAAGAGLARAVVLSATLERLDRETVAQLRAGGIAVVLLGPDGESSGRAWALGADRVLPGGTGAQEVGEAVLAALDPTFRSTPADDDAPVGATLAPLGSRSPLLSPAWTRSRTLDDDASPRGRGRRPPGGPPTPGTDVDVVPRRSVDGSVVAVWGPVGAPGRTTVATTLAAELAATSRHPVLLADADTYGASVAQALGLLDESAGLAAAARAANQGLLDLDRLARLAPVVWKQLRVLTGLPRPSRWPELRPSALEEVWNQARTLAGWTVVDCGFCTELDEELMLDVAVPRRNGATLSALAAADVVVAVGSGDPVGLQRLVRGLQDLPPLLRPGVTLHPVVNRVRASAVGSGPERKVREALERYAGLSAVTLVPEDRESCDSALLAGRSLTEHTPRSAARKALAGLAEELPRLLTPVAV